MDHGRYGQCQFTPDDRWLDVGAHAGFFAIEAAPHAGAVHAYEPNPETYEMLAHNVAHLPNVETYQYAVVAGDAGVLRLYLHPQPCFDSLVRKSEKWVEVACRNVNDVLAEHKINKLKINAEGVEHELVLAIEDWEPIESAVIEFHPDLLGDYEGFLGALRTVFPDVVEDRTVKHGWLVWARK